MFIPVLHCLLGCSSWTAGGYVEHYSGNKNTPILNMNAWLECKQDLFNLFVHSNLSRADESKAITFTCYP